MNMIVQPTNDIPRSVSPMPGWVHCRVFWYTYWWGRSGMEKEAGRFYWLLHIRASKSVVYMVTSCPTTCIFWAIAPEFQNHHTSFHVFQETWAHAIAVLDGRWWNVESLKRRTEEEKTSKRMDSSCLHQGSSNLEETTCLNFRQNRFQ